MTRVLNGQVRAGDSVFLTTQLERPWEVKEVGILVPERQPTSHLTEGQVGYVLVGIKDPKQSVKNLGCTIIGRLENVKIDVHTEEDISKLQTAGSTGSQKTICAIPSFQKAKQLVYCCLFPEDPEEFQVMDIAIHKLILEDPGVSITIESSPALGTGYRCGFLGVFHMEIFRERLSTEYNLRTISTFPTVVYKAVLPKGERQEVHNVLESPDNCAWEEPWVDAQILCRKEYESEIKALSEPRRGLFRKTIDMEDGQILLEYEFPMSEVITNFIDEIKSSTKGYGSLDYNLKDYRPSPIVKLVIYITDEPVDAMSFLVHKSKAYDLGKKICQNLREFIPSQLFDYNIQAKVGSRVIASEKVKGKSKNVIAKCYGGDYSRKRKLIENQKEGKKRMRMFGKVSMPAGAINSVFKNLQ
jgi:GTP-binding protein LepA